MANRAIFLDRDGVLNYPVLNPKTGHHEAPFYPEDYKFYPNTIEALNIFLNCGYKLFLISNQPDYAKGKTTFESLKAVHKRLESILEENSIPFKEFYYCYHHPEGTEPDYTMECECRKPGNLFLKQAKASYNIDMFNSWMIGDRDTDIYCGQASCVRTILILRKESASKVGKSNPEHKVNSLMEAAEIIREDYLKSKDQK